MRSCTHADGVTAGLLAGSAVIVVYFIVDLVRLDPFATPVGLTHVIVGPGQDLSLPVLAQAVTFLEFGVRLAVYTILHFAVFALVGIAAAWCECRTGMSGDVVTGAMFGAVVCTVAFYGAFSLAGGDFVTLPGWGGLVLVNAMAGAVMGGYLQLAKSGRVA